LTFGRVVAVGASAGGVTALRSLAAVLPADFAAPVLVVQHIGNRASILPELLSKSGPLPAVHPEDGAPLAAGRIYVAPPDHHMMVQEGRVKLERGPKENHARPAIDPLFRSVGLAYGPAAVGVVLTGGLDDGAAGLLALKRCGGVAIVQDPRTAEEPSMPSSAMAATPVDHCVPLESLAPLLVALSREPAAPAHVKPDAAVAYEHRLPKMEGEPMENLARIATPSGFVCPDCRGSLWRLRESPPVRYRCYTGHAYSLQSLRGAQDEGLDAALWNALRALEEKHAILREMIEAEGKAGGLQRQANEALDLAHRLRALIESQGEAAE
jgi:two-component system chemotaxis response regulator CheB